MEGAGTPVTRLVPRPHPQIAKGLKEGKGVGSGHETNLTSIGSMGLGPGPGLSNRIRNRNAQGWLDPSLVPHAPCTQTVVALILVWGYP